MNEWRFAISSADDAPVNAPILLKGHVYDNLEMAAALGYDAIEVHMRETELIDYARVTRISKNLGIKVAMLITGRLNTQGHVSLLDDDAKKAEQARQGLKRYIDIAAELDAGIVIGWVKGKVPEGGNREHYTKRLAEQLHALCAYGQSHNVPVNVEVINRYETNIFNTACETMDFINKYSIGNCYIHLDTFHMNIEEADIAKAIAECSQKLGYIHFADSNRRYPGSGHIDFSSVIGALSSINYKGYISLECLPYPDSKTAAIKALEIFKKS